MTTVVQESLSGIRVVKAFGARRYEGAKFEGRAAAVREQHTRGGLLSVARRAQSNLILNAAVLAVLWLGAREVAAGRLSAGEVATFMLYLGFVAFETFHAGFLITRWAQAAAAGQRILEVLDAESPVLERPDAVALPRVRGHVRFEQVSFDYESGAPALKGVDFEARPGQLVAILGAPGLGQEHAGPPDSQVLRRFGGEDLRRWDRRARRHPELAAPERRCRLSGLLRLCGYHRGQYRLRRRRSLSRRRGAGGKGGGPGRLHRISPGWVRHVGGRAGSHPLRGPAPEACHRSHRPDRPAPADTGRLHLQRRRGHRVPDTAGAGGACREPDDLRNRSQALHGPERRPHSRSLPRRDRGAGRAP